MTILGIETSCDETALCLIEAGGDLKTGISVKILANNILSQISIHREYGGVFPMLAKREHAKNLIPLFRQTLEEAALSGSKFNIRNLRETPPATGNRQLESVLRREPELLKQFLDFMPSVAKPPIDLISVTAGPGLEPALWVGINFAKALSLIWDIPVVAANHMEGHILISLLEKNEEIINSQFSKPNENIKSYKLKTINFPALALLISGGHTELVLMRAAEKYEVIGQTLDDAAGEAFDKVARILGLPYPGGPEISRLASEARVATDKNESLQKITLPRPMLHSNNLNFSFSGLKTAVLYLVKKLGVLDDDAKSQIAREFEDAVTEVLVEKTKKAVCEFGVKTLILGGGVTANDNIRETFRKLESGYRGLTVHIPAIDHSTDNALMIALGGFFHRGSAVTEMSALSEIKAVGNLQLAPFRDIDTKDDAL